MCHGSCSREGGHGGESKTLGKCGAQPCLPDSMQASLDSDKCASPVPLLPISTFSHSLTFSHTLLLPPFTLHLPSACHRSTCPQTHIMHTIPRYLVPPTPPPPPATRPSPRCRPPSCRACPCCFVGPPPLTQAPES